MQQCISQEWFRDVAIGQSELNDVADLTEASSTRNDNENTFSIFDVSVPCE